MKIVILISIIGMGLLMLNPAAAQMHSAPSGNMPMNTPMMQSHISSMATIMSEMAAFMQNGKMTPEQQAQCGAFMQRLSGMMQNMSADPQLEKTEQRQSELQALEKEWDYWKEKEEH
jgi:DNA repair ATPase RecN